MLRSSICTVSFTSDDFCSFALCCGRLYSTAKRLTWNLSWVPTESRGYYYLCICSSTWWLDTLMFVAPPPPSSPYTLHPKLDRICCIRAGMESEAGKTSSRIKQKLGKSCGHTYIYWRTAGKEEKPTNPLGLKPCASQRQRRCVSTWGWHPNIWAGNTWWVSHGRLTQSIRYA